MSESLLADQTFTTAHGDRFERVLAELLARVPEDGDSRVLEIGCGTGGTLFALAEARPRVTAVGVDLSPGSIEVAERARAEHPARDRVEFAAGEYLTVPVDGDFDVIVADQSLHLIGGSTDALCARLARQLRPGGLLLAEMPYVTPYNTALVGLRRVMRRLRGPRMDSIGLRVARRVHRGDMPDDQLQERIAYLYVVPERLAGDAFESALSAHGIERIEQVPMRQASPAQLKHDLRVFGRGG
jgi:SAM-dependent methyltransferase